MVAQKVKHQFAREEAKGGFIVGPIVKTLTLSLPESVMETLR